MKKYAVIVAGGSGERMGATVPKQFLLLRNKTLLQHTIEAFARADRHMDIIVVLPAGHMSTGEDIIKGMQLNNQVHFAEGGVTRFHSVKNGLALVSESSIVLVHDAVRCMVSTALIHRCCLQAQELGSAIPAVAATDSIRISHGQANHAIDRSTVQIIQTPQTFLSAVILPAFEQDYQENFTDEATVVEAAGAAVHLVEGDYNNLKITRPIDLLIAEKS